MKYILNELGALKKALEGKRVYLFLDYDGTLAPIAEKPAKASLSRKTVSVLEALAKNRDFQVAVISGRALKDIKERLGLRNIFYSGNHGLEIQGPGLRFRVPVTLRYKKILEQIKNDLRLNLSRIPGVLLEDKGLSLSLHFRRVSVANTPAVKTAFHETVKLYIARHQVKVREGKRVLEVLPPLEWDKGKAVLWLLGKARRQLLKKQNGIVPVYIGDDLTDEDAFKALGSRGVTVFAGGVRRSRARYYVKGPVEVTRLLGRLAVLQRGRDHGSITKG
ncbi:MAG: trehalose-phosphatase [Candidatus Omnitrophota bacterium]